MVISTEDKAYSEKLNRWRQAHKIACQLTGNRNFDTAILTVGIMAVEALTPEQLRKKPRKQKMPLPVFERDWEGSES